MLYRSAVFNVLQSYSSFDTLLLYHSSISWISLFQEILLWYNSRVSKDEYDCKTLNTAEGNICLLLASFKAGLSRAEGYGLKIQIVHQQIHGPANIDFFGIPKNVDARSCENNFVGYVKYWAGPHRRRVNYFISCVTAGCMNPW